MAKHWDAANGIPLSLWELDAQSYLDSFPSLASISVANNQFTIVDTEPASNKEKVMIGAVEFDKLFKNILADGNAQDFAINVSENNTPVFSSVPGNRKLIERWHQTILTHNGGLDWRIDVRPTAAFRAAHSSPVTLAVLVVGLPTAFLIRYAHILP